MTGIRDLCVEALGGNLGPQMAGLARPGFALRPAAPDAPRTGRCQAGGPAFLEPGTPWPQDRRGNPLSLYAVLDTEALASCAPEPAFAEPLPSGLGLVNVFAAGGLSEECTIVLADPARAVEVPVPVNAKALPLVRLHAAPIVTLPSVSGEDLDPVVETLDFSAELPEFDDSCWISPAAQFVQEPLWSEWPSFCRTEQGFTPGGSQAFGWPHIDGAIGVRADGYTHLLTLSGDVWDDNGFERVMVPADALRSGRSANAVLESDGLH